MEEVDVILCKDDDIIAALLLFFILLMLLHCCCGKVNASPTPSIPRATRSDTGGNMSLIIVTCVNSMIELPPLPENLLIGLK